VAQELPNRTIACIKVDVEGAEIKALRGTPSFLMRNDAPAWIIEINPETLARFACEPSEVVNHFDEKTFERWLLPKYLRDGRITAPPRRYHPLEKFSDALFYNLLALPLGARFADRVNRVRTTLLPTENAPP